MPSHPILLPPPPPSSRPSRSPSPLPPVPPDLLHPEHEHDLIFPPPAGETSFGSFIDSSSSSSVSEHVPAPGSKREDALVLETKEDPLGSTDLLGSFGDDPISLPSRSRLPLPFVNGGSLLSGSNPVQGGGNIKKNNGGGDLLGEIDSFLSAEETHSHSHLRGQIQGQGGMDYLLNSPPSSSSSNLSNPVPSNPSHPSLPSLPNPHPHPHPHPYPHLPPRRLSLLSHPGPSSPPAVSPLSSYSFRGKSGASFSHSHSIGGEEMEALATGTGTGPGTGTGAEGHKDDPNWEFGNWEGGNQDGFPTTNRASGSGTNSNPHPIATPAHPNLPGLDTSIRNGNGNGNGTRKPSWTTDLLRPGQVGIFPSSSSSASSSSAGRTGRKMGSAEGQGKRGAPGVDDFGAFTTEPSSFSLSPSQSQSQSQSQTQSQTQTSSSTPTLLSSSTRRMTGLVHALGTLATKSAGARQKSKWRTVVGPGTFHAPAPSGSGSGSGWGEWDDLDPSLSVRDGERERGKGGPGQVLEITHENPFNLGHAPVPPHLLAQNASGTGMGTGTGMNINPAMHYMNQPPSHPADLERHRLESTMDSQTQKDGRRTGTRKGKGEWTGTKLQGRREGTVVLLDEKVADSLRPNLPARQRLANTWTLLFSLDQHGASLSTFYTLIERYAQTHPHVGNLLIAQDAYGRRFGAYMNEPIRRVEGAYTGSGESWLYKIVDTGKEEEIETRVFKWTGRNSYFALCESEFISFGGGDGKYGLWIDKVFQTGSSAGCLTYGNEILCDPEGETGGSRGKGKFDCMSLEVWATSG